MMGLVMMAVAALAPQAAEAVWTIVPTGGPMLVAIQVGSADQEGHIRMGALTTFETPRQQPRPHRQVFEQFALDCDADRSGRGRIHILNHLRIAEAGAPVDLMAPGDLAEPVIVPIDRRSEVGRAAEAVCRGQTPDGDPVTGSWDEVLEAVESRLDLMPRVKS